MVWLHPLCLVSVQLWRARVPLICWKRVEWHLPDRVMRQFSSVPLTDIAPVNNNFKREDGRGHAGRDWMTYYAIYIAQWNNRWNTIVGINRPVGDGKEELEYYLLWYRSWAKIYLCEPPTEPPTGSHPTAPTQRILGDYFQKSSELVNTYLQSYNGDPVQLLQAFHQLSELVRQTEEALHIRHEPKQQPGRRSFAGPSSSNFQRASTSAHRRSDYAGPSTSAPRRSIGTPSQRGGTYSYTPDWNIFQPGFLDVNFHLGPTHEETPQAPVIIQPYPPAQTGEEEEEEEGHVLRPRTRRPPNRYTPGSDALGGRPRR